MFFKMGFLTICIRFICAIKKIWVRPHPWHSPHKDAFRSFRKTMFHILDNFYTIQNPTLIYSYILCFKTSTKMEYMMLHISHYLTMLIIRKFFFILKSNVSWKFYLLVPVLFSETMQNKHNSLSTLQSFKYLKTTVIFHIVSALGYISLLPTTIPYLTPFPYPLPFFSLSLDTPQFVIVILQRSCLELNII